VSIRQFASLATPRHYGGVYTMVLSI